MARFFWIAISTTDDDAHLRFTASARGNRPVLFVLNKADTLISEDEDAQEVLSRQADYLKEAGFSNPRICPVSAKAAWLAKKSRYESPDSLSRMESRELDAYIDKFSQYGFGAWYDRAFPALSVPEPEDEIGLLLKKSGMTYLEELIRTFHKGGSL